MQQLLTQPKERVGTTKAYQYNGVIQHLEYISSRAIQPQKFLQYRRQSWY